MKRVVLSVINDVATDNRVHKMSLTLMEMGFEVLVIGRKLKNSLPINRIYKVTRMKLLFNKKAIFYAEYNIRLFLKLLFTKADIFVANDLDTLPSNYLVSKIKHKSLVYDSHEYFTEVPELLGRKNVRKVWLTIEKIIFPNLNDIITVNDSIAKEYYKRYNKNLIVVRNLSLKNNITKIKNRTEIGLIPNKKLIIMQGAGININRGAEEMVMAMQYIENALLIILGNGDVINILKKMVTEHRLTEKIQFFPKMEYSEMMQYTMNADLGVTLDKLDNPNYLYSLPNKIFDYIQAGIPVLSSPVIEIKKIIENYIIGDIVHSHDPMQIAEKVNEIFNSEGRIKKWKSNIKRAASELCWENEKQKVIDLYSKFL